MYVRAVIALVIAIVGLVWPSGPVHAEGKALASVAALLITQGDQAVAAYDPTNGIDTSDLFSDLYFDVFEGQGLEVAIGLRDGARKGDLESRFSVSLSLAAGGAAFGDVQAAWKDLRQGLAEEENFYTANREDDGGWWPSFVQAFLILLREGVEALLVVGALITYVKRIGTKSQLNGLYTGIILALVASGFTAWAVRMSVLGLNGRSLEAVEGITMLVAAGVLFYVGHWLFSKREAERWQGYIKDKVDKAVISGSGFALSSAAFLAVYREGAETVLFYQALLSDRPDGLQAIAAGFVAAAFALAVIFVAIRVLGLRLPLKLFFTATAGLLSLLAFIFIGKGIVELQVIRWITATPLTGIPQIGWLGVFPTMESILAQATFLALIIWGVIVPATRKARV